MLVKRKGITVSRQIMDDQLLHPEATGELTGLLNDLVVAGKIISAEVNMAGLADILGQSGKTNIQGETVQKLDVFANQTIKRRMEQCGYVCVMASEEDDEVIPVLQGYEGEYTIAFDPLDGSSNIDVNVSIGTIFSIHRRLSSSGQGSEADLLQKGSRQVAAGYIIYGSSTVMVYTTGSGVHGFTLDPSVGEFFLSHPDITIPAVCPYYSVNEAYSNYWFDATRDFITRLKEEKEGMGPYSLRYIGSLVADFHRNLVKGGIFLYPRDKKSPEKSEGKLRLLYEAAPLAMVVEQAGGRAITDDGRRILDIEPTSLHQRVPLIIGSRQEVDLAEQFFRSQG
ncbi:class 1 fructose-bisphosphatase [Desulfogranum mediterraneum]|uniref:class 1 fructose-bisphosphatase n=1 Tax=Desulfogranum mediterraneum TaxID=160661 RepID=UPI0004010439|nr:class 1 fructose-bisphosphatase [Desulfogranum mediterraneum]